MKAVYPRASASGSHELGMLIQLDVIARIKWGPLWVKSRHLQCKTACPLYPQKRTSVRMTLIAREDAERSLVGRAMGQARNKVVREDQSLAAVEVKRWAKSSRTLGVIAWREGFCSAASGTSSLTYTAS